MNKRIPEQQNLDFNVDEETLLLYFYGELEKSEKHLVESALKASGSLNQKYQELTQFLDQSIESSIPAPGDSFEQNIMAAIYRESEQQKEIEIDSKNSKESSLSFWSFLPFGSAGGVKLALGGALSLVLVFSVFLFGRWTAGPVDVITTVDNSLNESRGQFSETSMQKLLNARLVEHLDAGDRIFTLVSNGNGDLAEQIKERQQLIEELVVFNRIYRRLASQKGDQKLAELLGQMERLLVELENSVMETNGNSAHQAIDSIKNRVEKSDLIFKLKVTNKKYQNNFI